MSGWDSDGRRYDSGLEVAASERAGHNWPEVALPDHHGSYPEVAGPGMKDKKDDSTPILATAAAPSSYTPYATPSPDYYHQSGYQSAGYQPGGYQFPPMQQMEEEQTAKSRGPRETIWGIRRKVFYIVLAVGILVAVAAIAIGVGAGIAFGHNNSSSPQPTPTPEPSTSGAEITCPAANNVTYQAQNTTKLYRVACDVDYNHDSGATELANLPASSMNACIDACASRAGCLYAGWGNFYGTNTCFMKTAIGKVDPTPGWYFAFMVQGNGTGSS